MVAPLFLLQRLMAAHTCSLLKYLFHIFIFEMKCQNAAKYIRCFYIFSLITYDSRISKFKEQYKVVILSKIIMTNKKLKSLLKNINVLFDLKNILFI